VYRDVPYPDHGLVVELDGRAFHDSAAARDRDAERDLDARVADETTSVRLTYPQVVTDGCRTVRKIATLLERAAGPVRSYPARTVLDARPTAVSQTRIAREGVGGGCRPRVRPRYGPRVTDWGELYRAHVAALGELAPGLTEEQLATAVPATPAWTVHDVFAHLAGGAGDAVTGRMEGAPNPEWTARHVAERAQLPVTELVGELRSHQDGLAAAVADNPRPALVWDVAVHHADLHEALGLPRMAEHLWLPVAEALSPRAGALVGSVPPYELFRALFSRRSRAQMQRWGSPLSVEELDALCVFGPREDDQPVPAGSSAG
jgi:uncharacterized protein (TIGR03083 family)